MTEREKLLRLADFMVEDIMAMSDEEILAEVSEEEIAEAMRIRDRVLEAAHCGGLSDLGIRILGFDAHGEQGVEK